MAEVVRYEEPKVWKGALAGAVAGLAASWVMRRFDVSLSRGLAGSDEPQPDTPLEHYSFGAAAGAFYGVLRETQHAPGGAAFGAELWVVAEQVGLPVAGLSPIPIEASPASTNAQHFAAHVVYGLTIALVYATVRRAL